MVVVVALLLIVIIGLATNNAGIGRLIGTSGAFFLEPTILLVGIIAGFSKSYKKLLINSFLLSLIMIGVVYYNVSQWHEVIGVSNTLSQHIYYYSIRTMNVFTLAHLVNIPIVLYFKK